MTSTMVLLLLSPFMLLVVVVGAITVVALLQARPEDIPVVVKECLGVFKRIAEKLPRPPEVPSAGMTRDTQEESAGLAGSEGEER